MQDRPDSLLSPWRSVLWAIVGCFMVMGWPLQAQVKVTADSPRAAVFGGAGREIVVHFENEGDAAVAVDVGGRLLQLTSATAAPVGRIPEARVPLGPRQTVLERFRVDLPEVRAETRFLVQWTSGGTRVLGRTEIRAYPTNLLGRLGRTEADAPIGVHDPSGQVVTALRAAGVAVEAVGESGLAEFTGKRLILGPYGKGAEAPAGLKESTRSLARRGVAVVLLQAIPGAGDRLAPRYRTIREGDGVIVQADPELVEGLGSRPTSQLNLVGLMAEALDPAPTGQSESQESK